MMTIHSTYTSQFSPFKEWQGQSTTHGAPSNLSEGCCFWHSSANIRTLRRWWVYPCVQSWVVFLIIGVSQHLLRILWRRIRRMVIFPMRKHWILDDFGVSYFQTEGGSDHEHLGFDWKKAPGQVVFAISRGFTFQYVASWMGKFLWFFLDPWSWDIYGNLWLRNAYCKLHRNWGWRWTKINIWVPSLEIYPCNIMQLWIIAAGSGYVS